MLKKKFETKDNAAAIYSEVLIKLIFRLEDRKSIIRLTISISESYDPAFDKWEIVGEMGSSRSWLSCVGLTVKMDSGTTCGEEKS